MVTANTNTQANKHTNMQARKRTNTQTFTQPQTLDNALLQDKSNGWARGVEECEEPQHEVGWEDREEVVDNLSHGVHVGWAVCQHLNKLFE